jgi:hypothetical protein
MPYSLPCSHPPLESQADGFGRCPVRRKGEKLPAAAGTGGEEGPSMVARVPATGRLFF